MIPKFNMLVNSSIVSAFKMIHRKPNILLLQLLLPMIVVTVVGDSHSWLKAPWFWRASHKVAALMNIVAGVIMHRQMNVLRHLYVHLFDSHKNRIELLRKKKCFHSDSNWKRKKINIRWNDFDKIFAMFEECFTAFGQLFWRDNNRERSVGMECAGFLFFIFLKALPFKITIAL